MNNKTRIIDLTVGQFLQLLDNRNLPVEPKLTAQKEWINIEKDLILKYLERPEKMEDVLLLTATYLKNYIEVKEKVEIHSMRYFGRELKQFLGKPIQKRGIGFCYKVALKNLTN